MAEGVRKRGKSWYYYFDTAKISGERKKIEKGGFKTQKEALNARAKAMAEYNDTGRTFSPKEISVADYLDYWLENAIKQNVNSGYSYNTYIDYERVIRNHLKPVFGMYKLSSFQYASDKIQKWIDQMKAKGYSKNMIKNTLTCLQGSMNYAINPLSYIQNNPCLVVKVGKVPTDLRAKEHSEYICPSEEFYRILERFPEGNHFHLSLVVPYHTGTRLGETFGIDLKEDVDFENHELHIRRQLTKVDGRWYFKSPKYESYRTIKIGSTLEKALRFGLQQHNINRMKFGGRYLKTYILPDGSLTQIQSDISVPYKEFTPLCLKEDGTFISPDSFKYCAKVIHYELGNKLFHAHCLRHTHGTILAEAGVNPKTVMERLGHKNIETTLQTYIFNTEVMQQKAVDIFEASLHA